MALKTPKAIAQTIMVVVIVSYYVTFISLGVTSIVVDSSLRSEKCGVSTHLWKYLALNSLFAGSTLLTYLSFPGGGEGARARSLMICILHIALAVWGWLMRKRLPECMSVIQDQYSRTYVCYNVAKWHNLVFAVLYGLHEVFIGAYFEADFTLVPEVRKVPPSDTIDYAYPPVPPHDPSAPGLGLAQGGVPMKPSSTSAAPSVMPPHASLKAAESPMSPTHGQGTLGERNDQRLIS